MRFHLANRASPILNLVSLFAGPEPKQFAAVATHWIALRSLAPS